jgi:hypothetical protein
MYFFNVMYFTIKYLIYISVKTLRIQGIFITSSIWISLIWVWITIFYVAMKTQKTIFSLVNGLHSNTGHAYNKMVTVMLWKTYIFLTQQQTNFHLNFLIVAIVKVTHRKTRLVKTSFKIAVRSGAWNCWNFWNYWNDLND